MAKSAEGIRQRKYKGRPIEGSYEINFRPFKGGNRVQKIIHAASIAEAKVKRAEMIAEALKEKAPVQNGSEKTFDEIWPEIENLILIKNLAHKTLLSLRCVYGRLFTDFRLKYYPQIKAPSQLDHKYFFAYAGYYSREINRKKGLRAEIRRVKGIMSRMRSLRYISEELLKDIRVEVKTPPRNEKNYVAVNNTDFKCFLNKIKLDRLDIHGPAYFMARIGRRVEETTLILRDDIRWDGYEPISINIRAETTKTDTGAPLNCLDNDLRAHIRFHTQRSKKMNSPYLFTNPDGKKFNQKMITKYLGKLSESMDLPRITSHYLRHRFCTETMKARLPIKDIQAISGIRNTEILLGYCHASEEGQASVLEKTRL